MRIVGNKVGIGTTAPDTVLTVSKSNATSGDLIHLQNPASSNSPDWYMGIGYPGSYDGYFRIGRASAGIDFAITDSGKPQTSTNWTVLGNGGLESINNGNTAITLNSGTHLSLSGRDYISYQISLVEKMRIDSSGNVGIGTSAPTDKLEIRGNAKIEQTSNVDAILRLNPNSGTIGSNYRWELVGRNSAENYNFQIREGSTPYLTIENSIAGNAGNVGIGTTAPKAKLQVEEYGIDTTTTSSAATTQIAIHTFPAADFRSAKYTIQVTNTTDSTYHITEILMIHNGTTPSITEYGTIFTGTAAEATFDADILTGNVRLLATPAAVDGMQFKVVCHSITV